MEIDFSEILCNIFRSVFIIGMPGRVSEKWACRRLGLEIKEAGGFANHEKTLFEFYD